MLLTNGPFDSKDVYRENQQKTLLFYHTYGPTGTSSRTVFARNTIWLLAPNVVEINGQSNFTYRRKRRRPSVMEPKKHLTISSPLIVLPA